MTESIWWLLVVVAFGLPSAFLGFILRRIEKKMDHAEAKRVEQESKRIEHEAMMIELSMASLGLAEATAEAVERIPDANCNGEMKMALNSARVTREKYAKYQRDLVAQIIAS